MNKHYVDQQGNFIGTFSGFQPPPILIIPEKGESYYEEQDFVFATPPEGAIEVSSIPEHAFKQKWSFELSVWVDAPKSKDDILAEIRALEEGALMPRGARETFILLCEQQGSIAGLTKEQLYAANPFYRGLIDTDTKARALRAQL